MLSEGINQKSEAHTENRLEDLSRGVLFTALTSRPCYIHIQYLRFAIKQLPPLSGLKQTLRYSTFLVIKEKAPLLFLFLICAIIQRTQYHVMRIDYVERILLCLF